VTSDRPSRPRYLTLTETAFSYALCGGLGYLAAGRVGAWWGVGLMSVLLARSIWIAASAPDGGERSA
jgi:hypothetical protein